MRKIISGLFITLDGVVEAPGNGDTTLPEKRGWSESYMNQEIGMSIFDAIQKSDAFLLGRRTFQEFAAFWPSMPAEDPFAQVINSMPKYVVSTTLENAEWNNSTLIKGNIVEEISRLKQQEGNNISIIGSPTLVHSLLEYGLIDEIQFLVCPVVLGVGKRLFNNGNDTKTLKLVETKPFDTGMVMLSYQPDKK